jgi:hypothetical protein
VTDFDSLKLKLKKTKEIEKKYGYRKKDALVDGRDVEMWTQKQIKGKELGRLILKVKRAYLNGEWKDRNEAKKWLDKYRKNSS